MKVFTMYLFYILCSGPSISITRVGWARNNAVFQVSLSVGSLKVLDGEWEKRFEGPRRETQQSTSISPALTFGNTKKQGCPQTVGPVDTPWNRL
ncbi:hypothetical protein GA685_01750 [Bifidobacterium adolescentis]|nr:hypothetical protein GA685_01750 [Bifidobacterium adolescentis]